MNLFLPRKRHLVTAVPAVVYAVNYPIIIQVISEIQEKSCAFVEMVKIVCCHSFFTRFFFSILICHIFILLADFYKKKRQPEGRLKIGEVEKNHSADNTV